MSTAESFASTALWRQFKVLLPVYLNAFMVGCTIGWTPNALYFMDKGEELSLSLTQISLIVSGTEIGGLLMAIPTGTLVNKFGRKTIIIATSILHFLSWLALSTNSSFITILIVRVILGVAYSLETATGLMTIGELASPEIRAKLIAIYQQFYLSGQGFEIVISLLFSSYFKLSYFTLAISASVLLFLCWILETPNFLISISRDEQAMKNLKYVRYGKAEDEILIEFDNLKTCIERGKTQELQTTCLDYVRFQDSGRPLLTLFLVYFFTIATGFCVLRAFITRIVPSNEFISTEYYPLLRFIICDGVMVLILPLYVEKFSRRMLFMLGAIGMAFCYLLLTVSYYYYSEFGNEACKWIFSFAYFSTGALVTGLVLPMLFNMRGEILPHHVKGVGGTFSILAESGANIVLIQIFNLMPNKFGLCYNFVIYAVNSLILFFLINYLVLECRGKYLSDIQNELIDNSLKKNAIK